MTPFRLFGWHNRSTRPRTEALVDGLPRATSFAFNLNRCSNFNLWISCRLHIFDNTSSICHNMPTLTQIAQGQTYIQSAVAGANVPAGV